MEQAQQAQESHFMHARDASRSSAGSSRVLEVPFPTSSSLATNLGDHHLFEQAFEARQSDSNEADYVSSPVRSQHAHPAEHVLASPSSILNGYQRPSIDQALPPIHQSHPQSLATVPDDAYDSDDGLRADGRLLAMPIAPVTY